MGHREFELPCTFKQAMPPLDDEYLPKLPAWFPLPARDEQGELLPQQPTEDERTGARRARALVEACEGPLDNTRGKVRLDFAGVPPAELVVCDGTVVYVRADAESNARHVVYRYSPQLSSIHAQSMRAVEDGFNEYGEQYAMEASKDDEHVETFGQQR